MTTSRTSSGGVTLQGRYAGVATRAGAFGIDIVTIAVLFALGGLVIERMLALFLGTEVSLSDSQVFSTVALGLWILLYLAYPLAVSGRTFGMSVLGLRAVRSDGSDLSARRAVVRVLALPLSFVLFGLGFLLIVLRRDHRALHDLIAGSAVVYAWRARAAHLRFLVRDE
jgi:uncharacterized RDD family membrane protein YckC